MTERKKNLREELILAGIDEINIYGANGFSFRRVAEACHVSSAAPVKIRDMSKTMPLSFCTLITTPLMPYPKLVTTAHWPILTTPFLPFSSQILQKLFKNVA